MASTGSGKKANADMPKVVLMTLGRRFSLRSLLVFALAFSAFGIYIIYRSFAATPITTPGLIPWLNTSGNKIVTADTNQSVVLRGANVMRSEWSSGYSMAWEQQAIPALAKWGGNIVLRGFASDPVNSNNAQYLSMLDQYVALATANKMYVVFVWRSDAPDGPQPNIPDASARAALPKLSARYKGNPHVMYGLQVEPHGTGSDWASLRPLFETMVDTIRTASAPYVPIVMVPGTNYSQDVSGAITNPVNRPNVVYKPHCYQPSSNYQAQFGNTYNAGLPVFIGEFAPAESATMSDMTTLLSYTRQRGIGWAAWWMDYSNQGTEALVNSATDLSPTNPWGIAIKTEMLTTPLLPTPRSTTTPTSTSTPTPIPTPTPTSISNTSDINIDGHVNVFDLSILLSHWGTSGTGDIDVNGTVNVFDLSRLLNAWTG